MPEWTPERVRRSLLSREPQELRELALYLLPAATAGRAYFLRRRSWIAGISSGKADDVQDVILALFDRGGQLLLNFGNHRMFTQSEEALHRYAVGVAYFVLLKKYRKYRVRVEDLLKDLATPAGPEPQGGWSGVVHMLDLERAIAKLAADDRTLFRLMYTVHLGVAGICADLGITEDTLYKRKSRLMARLRTLLDGSDSL